MAAIGVTDLFPTVKIYDTTGRRKIQGPRRGRNGDIAGKGRRALL